MQIGAITVDGRQVGEALLDLGDGGLGLPFVAVDDEQWADADTGRLLEAAAG